MTASITSNASTSTMLHNGSTAGTKPLAGVLSILRITTVGGTDTFDAGSVNILVEGY